MHSKVVHVGLAGTWMAKKKVTKKIQLPRHFRAHHQLISKWQSATGRPTPTVSPEEQAAQHGITAIAKALCGTRPSASLSQTATAQKQVNRKAGQKGPRSKHILMNYNSMQIPSAIQ
jgi:hypothetical protein